MNSVNDSVVLINKHQCEKYIEQLLQSLIGCDFTGYDTLSAYPALYPRLCERAGWIGGILAKPYRRALGCLLRYGGVSVYRLLSLPKVRNIKTLALSALGMYWECRRGVEGRQQMFEELLDKIIQERVGNTGLWRVSRPYAIRGKAIPPEAPGLINSLFCTQALHAGWLLTGNAHYSAEVVRTGVALARNQPYLRWGKGACFSYNRHSAYFVHNANLWAALVMLRGAELDAAKIDLLDLGEQCVRYSLDNLEGQEGIPYAGPPTENPYCDNYHAGYVLRALAEIRETGIEPELRGRIETYLHDRVPEYCRTFVRPSGVYLFRGSRRVLAHSLAEAILVYCTFRHEQAQSFDEFFRLGIQRSVDKLYDKRKGEWWSEVVDLPGGFSLADRLPMPRWSWAWMYLALSRLLFVEQEDAGSASRVNCGIGL